MQTSVQNHINICVYESYYNWKQSAGISDPNSQNY